MSLFQFQCGAIKRLMFDPLNWEGKIFQFQCGAKRYQEILKNIVLKVIHCKINRKNYFNLEQKLFAY
jgi:hypothetical protein